MRRHINIPIFIVHMGCPNQCVFCDQRLISGESCFSEKSVREDIEKYLAAAPENADIEIAFFGGSFTGIERRLMLRLLDLAQEYVNCGAVSGIRMSTRPDYIDEEIIRILEKYTVSAVELGIQSFSDSVLSCCRRGHTAEASERACILLKKAGIPFAAQMMIGLPGASPEDEMECARRAAELGASAYRVYPTVVFRGTELARMAERVEYRPLTNEEAAERMSYVMEYFEEQGVPCLRAGLCESDNLRDPVSVLAGANHPAIGDLARGEIFLRRMDDALASAGTDPAGTVLFRVPVGSASRAAGMNRRNIRALCAKYGIKSVKIIENPMLMGYNIIMEILHPQISRKGNRHCD